MLTAHPNDDLINLLSRHSESNSGGDWQSARKSDSAVFS